MERNPHSADLFSFRQVQNAAQTIEFAIQAQVKSAMSIGMFVQAAQYIVLLLLIQLYFIRKPEIGSALEVLLHEKQGFVRVCRGTQAGDGVTAVLCSEQFKLLMDLWEQVRDVSLFARHAGAAKAGPSFECVKAEPAFIAQPTFIYVDIPAANRPVNLPVTSRVAGNAPSNRSGRVVDAQVAARTAPGASRIRTFQKPHPDFESEITARQGSDRTSINDIHRIRIIQRPVFKNADLGIMTPVENLNLVCLRHIAREPNAARAKNASFLVELYKRAEIECFFAARFLAKRVAAVMPGVSHVVILKPTFTGLVANRAVDRMMQQ